MRYVDGETVTSEERKRLRYGRKGIAEEAITDFFNQKIFADYFLEDPPFPVLMNGAN